MGYDFWQIENLGEDLDFSYFNCCSQGSKSWIKVVIEVSINKFSSNYATFEFCAAV